MIVLSAGQELSPQELIRDLAYDGYQYNITADQPGVYAHRGEIVDVWIPSLDHITRITFGPQQIETITTVDDKGKPIVQRDSINIISGIITKKKKLQDFSFLIDLKPGDYIVHIDHGIGKFLRTQKQTMRADDDAPRKHQDTPKQREYFVIEYAEKDTLYVPVESADRIDKYVGGTKPHLHRLSGAGWYQLTKKIQEDVERTAKELIALYAQRAVVTAKQILPFPEEEQELSSTFLFDETADQSQAIEEVLRDLTRGIPMDRLVCGDVGFGKTEVAIRAAYRMVLNGYQVAILTPTTILAQQHFDNFAKRFEPLNVRVDLLSRFKTRDQQTDIVQKLTSGQADLVIGTHRILSRYIKFKNLGLIVIDEEQKFGVKHKEALKKLRNDVHVLALSATPIPRTLHFSISGLRDISVITTPPHGRLPVKTYIDPYQNEQMIKAVTQEVARNGQIYYLYNRVETMPTRLKQLRAILPDITIEMAHGQMTERQLVDTMHRFDIGEIDMLVCSTIIENGLDLPNVNTLIVEDSTKLGLAQMYQLRGRIGRSHTQAYAYFMYHQSPDAMLTEKETKRFEALEQASKLGSGFQLAMRDIEIRGVGNMLGKAQHGNMRAIGLSFYSRLLSQAIEEIKTGHKAPIITDITIDLPLAYGIPISLEPNEQKRMALYQKLANIHTFDELESERRIYSNNHNTFSLRMNAGGTNTPHPYQNDDEVITANDRQLISIFFDILELKILGRDIGATSIIVSTQKDIQSIPQQKLTISFWDHAYAKRLDTLMQKQPYWKVGDKQLKTNLKDMGDDWLLVIKQTLQILAHQNI